MRRHLVFLALLPCMSVSACDRTEGKAPAEIELGEKAASERHPNERQLKLASPSFHVDQIFESMLGPMITVPIRPWRAKERELLWLTGYKLEIVGADGQTPESKEFECHTNLAWHENAPPDWSKRAKPRIFTLTQGQTDVRLPRGFGMPMLSDETLRVNTQVLNLNEPEIDRTVVHQAYLRYVRDLDLAAPMNPLIATNAEVMVSLEEESLVPDVEAPDEHLEGASCNVGEYAGNKGPRLDRFGRRFTPHWVVPPGRHEFHTLVTQRMAIPYDTTVHFIGVHAHPHSESLELRDLTADETVFKSFHQNLVGRRGLVDMDYFSSEEGIPIYKDHHYELISIYNNPEDHDTDAMAVMFIYYLDKEFKHPLKARGRAQANL